MSVRIYQISKQINLSNKELITLLQERGLKVDSPSNTIPDIYAEDLLKEFLKPVSEPTPSAEKIDPIKEKDKTPPSPVIDKENRKNTQSTPPIIPPITPSIKPIASGLSAPIPPRHPATPPVLPQKPSLSHFVKSAQEVAKERELKNPHTIATPSAPIVHPKPLSNPPLPPRPAAQSTPSSNAPKLPPKVSTPPFNHTSSVAPKAPIVAQSSPSPVANGPTESKILNIKPPIVVRDFATLIGIKPFRLISELMEMGIFASMNQSIDEDTAAKLAIKHGFTLEIRHRGETPPQAIKKEAPAPKPVRVANLQPRPPVVCVLGHVDHGKTSLLDTIRKTNVTSGEAGGITQHIGAYQVEHNSQKITFIDTPGHAAFSKMRERGANITDIAILVVAADDGFMPQTDEALKFAQKANVPLIVAINKMDAKGANIDRVKQQMQQRGITSEDWGGQVLCTPISAIKNQNIDALLELVLLQAEFLELKADPEGPCEGTVIESQIEMGRGCTASVIIQQGTLKIGDSLVCGPHYSKVKALVDSSGKNIKSAPPSTPVRIISWSGTLESGAQYTSVKNEKEAKQIAAENAILAKSGPIIEEKDIKKLNINDLFEAIANTKQKCLRVIIKGDVHGSVEALKACLESIQSTKVNLEVIAAGVGSVTPSDISSAQASQAAIIGFNTKLENGVQGLLKQHSIRYISHNIIYELITQVKEAMSELLDPELRENKLGAAQIRQVFPLGKSYVAGCMVTEGIIKRDGRIRLIRGKNIESESRITTLKRFKDDVNEVRSGYECGIQLNNIDAFKEGDIIECYEILKIRPTL